MESPRKVGADVTDFDISTPIDIDAAASGYGPYGVENFYNVVPYFETMTLKYAIDEISKAYDDYNPRRFAQFAKNLKDGCFHIGAGQIFYICWFIEKEYDHQV